MDNITILKGIWILLCLTLYLIWDWCYTETLDKYKHLRKSKPKNKNTYKTK